MVVRCHFMRLYYFLIFVLSIGGMSAGQCQVPKSQPLVITANEVMTNSIRIAPLPTMTNVYVNFRFEGKSVEEIMALVPPNVWKPVIIVGVDSTKTQGVVQGVLASNSIPVGIVVSFQTREDAMVAAKSLRVRDKL